MTFRWNSEKATHLKRVNGIHFRDAVQIWKDSNALEIPVLSEGEARWAKVGRFGGFYYTVIFTLHFEVIKLISARRSSPEEVAFYEQSQKKHHHAKV